MGYKQFNQGEIAVHLQEFPGKLVKVERQAEVGSYIVQFVECGSYARVTAESLKPAIFVHFTKETFGKHRDRWIICPAMGNQDLMRVVTYGIDGVVLVQGSAVTFVSYADLLDCGYYFESEVPVGEWHFEIGE